MKLLRDYDGMRREIRVIDRNSIDLVLHLWKPEAPIGTVFYLHGLQSHAGWLWEAGRHFAANGVAFYALDRRGCGVSGGSRTELPDVDTMIGDVRTALAHVRECTPRDQPLGLFGHCLGGSVLAGLLHSDGFDIPYDMAMFCSSWLGKLHMTMDADQRHALATCQDESLWDAGLRAEDFTGIPQFRDYVANDPLARRSITAASRRQILKLEELYVGAGVPKADVPITYLSGRKDRVIDLDRSRKAFSDLAGNKGRLVDFDTDKHYLLFTEARYDLIDWVSTHVASHGAVI